MKTELETLSRVETVETATETTRIGNVIEVTYKKIETVVRWPDGKLSVNVAYWEGETGTGLIRRPGYSNGHTAALAALERAGVAV